MDIRNYRKNMFGSGLSRLGIGDFDNIAVHICNSLDVGSHGTIYLQENMILAVRKSATLQSSLSGVGFANTTDCVDGQIIEKSGVRN